MLPSKKQISTAGKNLTAEDIATRLTAFSTVAEWRTAHSVPLAKFASMVRGVARTVTDDAIVSQRLKRMPSIIDKLERNPSMALARMQDIAGVRAIVADNTTAYAVLEAVQAKVSESKRLVRITDYISEPKKDGYRGIHCIFVVSGFSVELQIRTLAQHRLATAVETLGALTGASIKTGRGTPEQEEFFRLVCALYALQEGKPLPIDCATMTQADIVERVKVVDASIGAIAKLESAYIFDAVTPAKSAKPYYVVSVDASSRAVTAMTYSDASRASEMYGALETATSNDASKTVALVATTDAKTLKAAYPNFFFDAKKFVEDVKKMTS